MTVMTRVVCSGSLVAVLHFAIEVVDLPKELSGAQLEAAEVVLAVRIIVLVELVERRRLSVALRPSPCREAHRRPPSS